MWRDFCESKKEVAYETYRKIFEKQKITFGQPPQDECDICLSHKMHQTEVDENHDPASCDSCRNANEHIQLANRARTEYNKPTEEGVASFSVDMQKIILLPKLTTKEHFFVSRLVVFNETFACRKRSRDLCMLWHEGIKGRSAKDVASSYVKAVTFCDKNHVEFWADNCGAQNKNWTLYNALVLVVNAERGPESITMKYLV